MHFLSNWNRNGIRCGIWFKFIWNGNIDLFLSFDSVFFFCYSLVTFTFRHSIWLTRSAVCTIKVKSLVCSVNSTLIKSTSMLTPALVTISCSVFNTVQCIYLQRNDYIHFTCANANSNCMNGKNTFNSWTWLQCTMALTIFKLPHFLLLLWLNRTHSTNENIV